MQQEAPTSRSYTHDRCKQETIVADAAFSNMASPLSDITLTYCSGCKGMFQVSEFAWTDTGENLIEYRKRLAGHAGPVSRFLCSKTAVLCMLALAVLLGVAGAQWLSPVQRGLLGFAFTALGIGFVSVVVLAGILVSVITPMVHKRVCGESDPRQLR